MTDAQALALAALMRQHDVSTATLSLKSEAYGFQPGGIYVVLVPPKGPAVHEFVPPPPSAP